MRGDETLTINHPGGAWPANLNPGGVLALNNSATWTRGFNFPSTGPNSFVNIGTAILAAYLGMGSATIIVNSGAMTLTNGIGDISANSSFTNNRGATFRVVGQFVNSGTVCSPGCPRACMCCKCVPPKAAPCSASRSASARFVC